LRPLYRKLLVAESVHSGVVRIVAVEQHAIDRWRIDGLDAIGEAIGKVAANNPQLMVIDGSRERMAERAITDLRHRHAAPGIARLSQSPVVQCDFLGDGLVVRDVDADNQVCPTRMAVNVCVTEWSQPFSRGSHDADRECGLAKGSPIVVLTQDEGVVPASDCGGVGNAEAGNRHRQQHGCKQSTVERPAVEDVCHIKRVG